MSDISTISIMFEEVKQMLKRIETNSTKANNNTSQEPSISTSDIAEITNRINHAEQGIVSKLEEIGQIQAVPKKVSHKISIDIASSWVFLTIIGFGLLLIVSFFFHYQQRETIKSLRDNDLKYRYIKAFNKSDTVSIHKLEDIFEYNRDYEKIKQIRKITIQYEDDVRDRARRLEQAKLKEEEAAKLQMEANKLKKKKK